MTIHSAIFKEWQEAIVPSNDILRTLAGKTEEEFLQIGGRLQDFYGRSCALTSLANSLVETVSGDQAAGLIARLRQMLTDMDAYITSAHHQSNESSIMLETVLTHLEKISEPLEGFQKLTKTLRMLGISTKIESARMGEAGLGFVTLAQDVEKLSHQVNEKSSHILGHRQSLATSISESLRSVRQQEHSQARTVNSVLANIGENLENLIAINQRSSNFGELVSAVSADVTGNISEVVSSMQMHDMTRQQVEHIIEALEKLLAGLDTVRDDETAARKLIVEAGDVCELQEAQLRFATTELCNAVRIIVDNLKDVAEKQARMAAETVTVTGNSSESGSSSFMAALRDGMATVTAVLAQCAEADRRMSQILSNVADTLKEVTGFVTDIEEIGSEIELIALNAQVKAALTGDEGAALGVLAEAVKRLSDDAITQTDSVSRTLKDINNATERLFQEASSETVELQQRIEMMEEELKNILNELGTLNSGMTSLLGSLTEEVYSLTSDIDTVTMDIDVDQRVRQMADQVMAQLDRIVTTSRQIEPASSEFKNNLKFMEQRYTMQSERHIHEAIARKRSGGSAAATVVHKAEAVSSGDSEFGDNVDLF